MRACGTAPCDCVGCGRTARQASPLPSIIRRDELHIQLTSIDCPIIVEASQGRTRRLSSWTLARLLGESSGPVRDPAEGEWEPVGTQLETPSAVGAHDVQRPP